MHLMQFKCCDLFQIEKGSVLYMSIVILLLLWQVHIILCRNVMEFQKSYIGALQQDEKDVDKEAIARGAHKAHFHTFVASIFQYALWVWLAVAVFDQIKKLGT